MVSNRIKKTAVVLATSATLGLAGIGAVSAQGPTNPGGNGANGGPGGLRPGAALICSTSDYTDIAAKALGMDSAALRVALVGGKRLTDIAAAQNVTVQTVQDALTAARDADLQQAVKDGLLTQAQYDAIKARQNQAPAAAPANQGNATPDAAQPNQNPNGNNVNPQGPRQGGGRGFGFGGGFGGISPFYQVHTLNVAADAIGVTCADLVKAVQGGQSIAQVATTKNVQAQTVIDALVKAEKDALAKDVSAQLMTQAQADTRITQLSARVEALVNNTFQGRDGGFGPGGPRNGDSGKGQQGPNDGPKGDATASPNGSSSSNTAPGAADGSA